MDEVREAQPDDCDRPILDKGLMRQYPSGEGEFEMLDSELR